MQTYSDLKAWQEAVEFCVTLYQATNNFPKHEQFGLTAQLRRAAVSIPSNLAEGQKRQHANEFYQFCRIAYASGAEIETQLIIANRVGYINDQTYQELLECLTTVMKLIHGLMKAIKTSSSYKP